MGPERVPPNKKLQNFLLLNLDIINLGKVNVFGTTQLAVISILLENVEGGGIHPFPCVK